MANQLIYLALCFVGLVFGGEVEPSPCDVVAQGKQCGELNRGVFMLLGQCGEGDVCYCKPEKPERPEEPGNGGVDGKGMKPDPRVCTCTDAATIPEMEKPEEPEATGGKKGGKRRKVKKGKKVKKVKPDGDGDGVDADGEGEGSGAAAEEAPKPKRGKKRGPKGGK